MLLFESSDLSRTEEFLAASYAPMRIASTTDTAAARIARVASAAINVDRVVFDFEMSYDVEPLGRICLCDVTSGAIEDHGPDGSEAQAFGPGEMFTLAPPDRPYAGKVNHASYTVTMIAPAILNDVASPAGGEVIELLDHRPTSADAARRLRAAIDHLDQAVLSDPVAAASPLLLGAAARYVAAQVLAAFPSTARLDARTTDSRDAHPAALRRAVAFIEDNADLDITPAQVAGWAHVSVRSLQLAFRRHLDTTPMAYLREVRMARVRRELVEGDGSVGVAEIATRWGFLHQGHFGQAYRRAYGETPGATLRGEGPAPSG
ncbi:AraC family transcriptional regulator [Nocardioides aromaticivorans]|uniref:AraC family transcriptional regulator n=1 Tax=Nocardioides aromaticivorans TaxID=200618 RepID=A0ABX7PRQ6_9ACTN|nr:helix-turn-helix transcriptional regulator [Nocardioides aromaticivorans]QSR28494.1 AraC family transcriptional regulator [Nocardioides aromaticivorans]